MIFIILGIGILFNWVMLYFFPGDGSGEAGMQTSIGWLMSPIPFLMGVVCLVERVWK